MKCAHCGKRIWFWQAAVITGKKVGRASVIHYKCLEGWYLK